MATTMAVPAGESLLSPITASTPGLSSLQWIATLQPRFPSPSQTLSTAINGKMPDTTLRIYKDDNLTGWWTILFCGLIFSFPALFAQTRKNSFVLPAAIIIGTFQQWACYRLFGTIKWPYRSMLPEMWRGEIFCDISIRLLEIWDALVLGCLMALARLMCRSFLCILRPHRYRMTPYQRRRERIIIITLILGPPLIAGPIHYIVQPARYTIASIEGCTGARRRTWVSMAVQEGPPSLYILVSLCYVLYAMFITLFADFNRNFAFLTREIHLPAPEEHSKSFAWFSAKGNSAELEELPGNVKWKDANFDEDNLVGHPEIYPESDMYENDEARKLRKEDGGGISISGDDNKTLNDRDTLISASSRYMRFPVMKPKDKHSIALLSNIIRFRGAKSQLEKHPNALSPKPASTPSSSRIMQWIQETPASPLNDPTQPPSPLKPETEWSAINKISSFNSEPPVAITAGAKTDPSLPIPISFLNSNSSNPSMPSWIPTNPMTSYDKPENGCPRPVDPNMRPPGTYYQEVTRRTWREVMLCRDCGCTQAQRCNGCARGKTAEEICLKCHLREKLAREEYERKVKEWQDYQLYLQETSCEARYFRMSYRQDEEEIMESLRGINFVGSDAMGVKVKGYSWNETPDIEVAPSMDLPTLAQRQFWRGGKVDTPDNKDYNKLKEAEPHSTSFFTKIINFRLFRGFSASPLSTPESIELSEVRVHTLFDDNVDAAPASLQNTKKPFAKRYPPLSKGWSPSPRYDFTLPNPLVIRTGNGNINSNTGLNLDNSDLEQYSEPTQSEPSTSAHQAEGVCDKRWKKTRPVPPKLELEYMQRGSARSICSLDLASSDSNKNELNAADELLSEDPGALFPSFEAESKGSLNLSAVRALFSVSSSSIARRESVSSISSGSSDDSRNGRRYSDPKLEAAAFSSDTTNVPESLTLPKDSPHKANLNVIKATFRESETNLSRPIQVSSISADSDASEDEIDTEPQPSNSVGTSNSNPESPPILPCSPAFDFRDRKNYVNMRGIFDEQHGKLQEEDEINQFSSNASVLPDGSVTSDDSLYVPSDPSPSLSSPPPNPDTHLHPSCPIRTSHESRLALINLFTCLHWVGIYILALQAPLKITQFYGWYRTTRLINVPFSWSSEHTWGDEIELWTEDTSPALQWDDWLYAASAVIVPAILGWREWVALVKWWWWIWWAWVFEWRIARRGLKEMREVWRWLEWVGSGEMWKESPVGESEWKRREEERRWLEWRRWWDGGLWEAGLWVVGREWEVAGGMKGGLDNRVGEWMESFEGGRREGKPGPEATKKQYVLKRKIRGRDYHILVSQIDLEDGWTVKWLPKIGRAPCRCTRCRSKEDRRKR